jgi:hypothetical protein
MYYVPEEDIVQLAQSSRRILSWHHRFDLDKHPWGDEVITIRFRSRGDVSFAAKGNIAAYRHSDMQWIRANGGALSSKTHFAAAVVKYDHAGSVLTVITKCDRWLGTQQTWTSRLWDLVHKVGQSEESCDSDDAVGVSPGSLGLSTLKTVHAGVLRRVVEFSAGKLRTPELLQTCHSLAVRGCRENGIPDKEAIHLIPAAAAQGFAHTLSAENKWLSWAVRQAGLAPAWLSYLPKIARRWFWTKGEWHRNTREQFTAQMPVEVKALSVFISTWVASKMMQKGITVPWGALWAKVRTFVVGCFTKAVPGTILPYGSLQHVHACAVSPLLEEALKQRIRWITPLIIAFEWIRHRTRTGRWVGGSREYWPTAFMHVITGCMNFHAAVGFHALYNYLALTGTRFAPGEIDGTHEEVFSKLGRRPIDYRRIVLHPLCVREMRAGDPKKVPRHGAELKVSTSFKCKSSNPIRNMGLGVSAALPHTLRSCTCNEVAGLLGRVLSDTPWCNAEGPTALFETVVQSWNTLHLAATEGHLAWAYWKPLTRGPAQPCMGLPEHSRMPIKGREVYLSKFPAARRERLANAYDAFLRSPRLDGELQYQSFVKVEKGVIHFRWKPEGTKIPDPRIIQGRRDGFNVASGPWLTQVGRHLALNLGVNQVDIYPCGVAYGLTAEQLGTWYTRALDLASSKDPKGEIFVVNSDAHRWDKSTPAVALDRKLDRYEKLGLRDPLLTELRKSVAKKGQTKLGTKYRVDAGVGSGDGDTSGGNSDLHLLIELSNADRCGLKENQVFPYRSIVASDDGLTVVSQKLFKESGGKEAYEQHLLSYGYSFDMAVGGRFDAEFCSGRFWPVQDGWVFGPKIGRVLAKTFWSDLNLSPHKEKAWLRGVALGLERSVSHIPILRAVVRRILQLTAGVNPRRFPQHEWKFRASENHEACESTWLMMYHLYGVDTAEVTRLEQLIMSVDHLPATLTDPTLDIIVEKDWS